MNFIQTFLISFVFFRIMNILQFITTLIINTARIKNIQKKFTSLTFLCEYKSQWIIKIKMLELALKSISVSK